MNSLKLTAISILFLVTGVGCGKKSEGVNDFLGLKFGQAQINPVKIGPREPPAFWNDLREFYEINFPNQEFSFVGVALTKNTPEDIKEGLFFEKEGMVWASFFNENNYNCTEADSNKLKKYIEKNYGAKVTKEDRTVTPTLNGQKLTQIYTYLYSPYVAWQINCVNGEYGNKTLIIRDYSVLVKYGNPKLKKVVEDSIKEGLEILKRKID